MQKTTKDIVQNYYEDIYDVQINPEMAVRLEGILESIEKYNDEKNLKLLKYNCNYIDKKLFDKILKSKNLKLEKEIKIEDIELKGYIRLDVKLQRELKYLISSSRLRNIGFFKEKKKENFKLNINQCVEYIKKSTTIIMLDNELKIYNRREGIYEDLTEELFGIIFHYIINNIMKDSWNKNYEKNVLDGLYRSVDRVNKTPLLENYIAVKNGVYDLNTRELLKHDKKFFLENKVPVTFERGAKCPIFEKTIKEILENDEELIKCMQEIFGYTLMNTTKAEKAFFFYGIGSNGKSLCANILMAIIGKDNVSNIPLARFSDKFGIEGILDKSLNIANENEFGNAISTEVLKALISGDSISIARKFKKAIDYKSQIKLIFLMNSLPNTLDNTHGFYRKILIIPFRKVFKEQDIDRDLYSKIVETELSGILNWAIEGAERLKNNKYEFTKSKAINKVISEYKRNQNPVEEFLVDRLIYDETEKVSKKDVLNSYKDWIKNQGLTNTANTPQKFWKNLEIAIHIILDKEISYKKINGERFLNNFKLKPDENLKDDFSFDFIS